MAIIDEEKRDTISSDHHKSGWNITILVVIVSLIILLSFIALFPKGLHLEEPTKISYEGNMLQFYGKIDVNGTVKLISQNAVITIDNDSQNYNNVEIEGNLKINCPIACLNGINIITDKVLFEGRDCLINGFTYSTIAGEIEGNLSLIVNGSMKLSESHIENRTLPFIDKEFSDVFPMRFDRVGFVSNGTVFINRELVDFKKQVFFRGTGTYDGMRFKGSARLIAIDNIFYGNVPTFFFIPLKIILVWGISIIFFILSLYIKKDIFSEKDKIFKTLSYVLPPLFFFFSFFLWNAELKYIFGFDFFSLNNISNNTILFVSFAIVPYLVAIGIIWLPTNVAIFSIFKIIGLSNLGRTIGRSTGFILATLWGATLASALLNLTLSPLLRLI